jgi:hypothetical protein
MKISPLRLLLLVGIALGLWMGALAIRRAVFHQQTRSLEGKEAPFLKESALQFRMTRMVAEEGGLPERDENVGVPDGVTIRKTYSVGAEWVYAGLSKLLPGEWSLTARIRWVSAALFSLAVPFAFLWIWLRTGSIWGGTITGVLLMVSPAFAVRSSGLELSRENLAIPLFVLFFALQAGVRKVEGAKARWVLMLLSGMVIALAQCSWDLTQYVIGLWAVGEWTRMFCETEEDATTRNLWGVVTGCLVGAAVLNPYLREHGFLFSPVMAILIAGAIMPIFEKRFSKGMPRLGIGVGLGIAWVLLGRLFYENYSHFSSLLAAKIQFGNVKPVDPSVLTPIQRIMWTPALNSSTWALTKAYFPISLLSGCVAVAILLLGRSGDKQRGERTSGNPELIYALFTLPVYVLFFRFHVFLILYLAGCIGILVSGIARHSSPWIRTLLPLGLTLFLFGVEFYRLLFFEPDTSESMKAERYAMRMMLAQAGISNPMLSLEDNRWAAAHKLHYLYVEQLINSLNANLKEADTLANPSYNEPVLAAFGISGTILTYADMPIVLHPKFETPGIREKVLAFYDHLYRQSELELRDWALAQGSRYYLHQKGGFTSGDLRNSPPYMVDALPPPEASAWYLLENNPYQSEWFFPIPLNHPTFQLFRIISDEDVNMAEQFTQMALARAKDGDYDKAEEWALRALTYHWKYKPAQNLLANVRNAKRRNR